MLLENACLWREWESRNRSRNSVAAGRTLRNSDLSLPAIVEHVLEALAWVEAGGLLARHQERHGLEDCTQLRRQRRSTVACSLLHSSRYMLSPVYHLEDAAYAYLEEMYGALGQSGFGDVPSEELDVLGTLQQRQNQRTLCMCSVQTVLDAGRGGARRETRSEQ